MWTDLTSRSYMLNVNASILILQFRIFWYSIWQWKTLFYMIITVAINQLLSKALHYITIYSFNTSICEMKLSDDISHGNTLDRKDNPSIVPNTRAYQGNKWMASTFVWGCACRWDWNSWDICLLLRNLWWLSHRQDPCSLAAAQTHTFSFLAVI